MNWKYSSKAEAPKTVLKFLEKCTEWLSTTAQQILCSGYLLLYTLWDDFQNFLLHYYHGWTPLSRSQILIISICSVSSPTCWERTAERGAWNWTFTQVREEAFDVMKLIIIQRRPHTGSTHTLKRTHTHTSSWVQNPPRLVSSSVVAATLGSGAWLTPSPSSSPW